MVYWGAQWVYWEQLWPAATPWEYSGQAVISLSGIFAIFLSGEEGVCVTQVWRVGTTRTFWGLHSAGCRALCFFNHWAVASAGQLIFWRAFHFKNWAGKSWSSIRVNYSTENGHCKLICQAGLTVLSRKPGSWMGELRQRQNQCMEAFGAAMVEQIKREGYSLLLLPVKRKQCRRGIIP